MADHFVEFINIKRYKCFRDFSAVGFGRVNLIAGKNNVGKTAFLEALSISAGNQDVQDVIRSLFLVNVRRHQIDHDGKVLPILGNTKNILGEIGFHTNIAFITYSFDDSSLPGQFKVSFNSEFIEIAESNLLEAMKLPVIRSTSSAYISSVGDDQKGIISSFVAVQKKDRESDVDKIVQSFDDSIEGIKVIGGNSIECKVSGVNGNSSYRNISEFGDGLRHYISIIADLFAAEHTYLFIDEIDNGIHYSSLDNLWEIILTLSKELNVQVFATTHSKECIEAYSRAVEKLEDKDITFTTLVKNKEKEVKAIVRDYELFTDSIHDAHEVRGW